MGIDFMGPLLDRKVGKTRFVLVVGDRLIGLVWHGPVVEVQWEERRKANLRTKTYRINRELRVEEKVWLWNTQ